MTNRTKWKTVIDGDEKTHRSERATYDFLLDWVASAEDGAKATVFVLEPGRSEWQTFERHKAFAGLLDVA